MLKYGVLAQAFYFLTIPIVIWKFNPSGYGVFTIAFSAASIVGSVAAFRVERALVVESVSRIGSILKHCISYILLSSSLCFLLTYFAFQFANRDGGEEAFSINGGQQIAVSFLAAIYCFIFGLIQVLVHVAIRQQKVVLTGVSDLAFTLSLVVLMISVPVSFVHEAIVLFIAFIIARLIAVLPYRKLEIRSYFEDEKYAVISFGELRKYYVPMVTAVLSNIQFRGLFYLTGITYGEAVTGNLALTQRVVYAPVNLIGASLRKSFFLEFTENRDDFGKLHGYILKVLTLGSLVSMLCFLPFVVVCRFTEVYLPVDWKIAILFAIAIYPTASILVLLSWLDRVYDAKEKQLSALICEIAYTICLYVFIFIALAVGVDAVTLVEIFTLVTVIYNSIWAGLTLRLIGASTKPAAVLVIVHLLLFATSVFLLAK